MLGKILKLLFGQSYENVELFDKVYSLLLLA